MARGAHHTPNRRPLGIYSQERVSTVITSTAKTIGAELTALKEHILPSIVASTVILIYFGDDSSNFFYHTGQLGFRKKRAGFGNNI
jgi:hypothetical protein